ncbi:serine protease 57-like isoform X1 [Equus quagga]|uniref:serine protease 57-like isoform X1 n=1 Tax=Equus quagga TaxID=89248 RepID=UPI001EE238DA|nr:serine protease 57-like isoform X1 [Equus quagga]
MLRSLELNHPSERFILREDISTIIIRISITTVRANTAAQGGTATPTSPRGAGVRTECTAAPVSQMGKPRPGRRASRGPSPRRDPRADLVVLGAHALRVAEPTQQVLGVSAVVSHPDYQPATHANDICLLRLNSSAVLGPAVGLLKLPRSGARPPRAGTLCRVAGWGSVSDFEDQPPGLMEAEVRVLGLDACNRSWTGLLKPAMLCTHSEDSQRRGFCSADSGGPLVCRNRAHGLVSFSGLWCGDPKTPDVYTQVSAFVSWIWDVVRQRPHGPQPSPPGVPAGAA